MSEETLQVGELSNVLEVFSVNSSKYFIKHHNTSLASPGKKFSL